VGAGNSYYDRTAPPKATAPMVPPGTTAPATSQQVPPRAQGQSPYFASGGTWKPAHAKPTGTPGALQGAAAEVGHAQVRTASYNAPSSDGKAAAASAGKETTASPASKLRLNGMPVTDATKPLSPGEPARFTPPENVVEISQLPRVAGASQPAASGSGSPSTPVVSSAKASDNVTPASATDSTSESTLQWKSRPSK
jgi:hypothetical protein